MKMKPLRKEIASLVTGVGEGLSESAKDLGDLALQKYRKGRVRRGLAAALNKARKEVAKKLKPRRKKATSRTKIAKSVKPRRKKATAQTKSAAKPKEGRKNTTSRTKAKQASRSPRSRTS
jgi:peptidoglycan hydrolase CwlO-like protein